LYASFKPSRPANPREREYQTHLTTLKISHFPNNFDQLPDLQPRIGLQDKCDITVVSTGEGPSAAVQGGDGAE
jgi:hypothetical protein